MNESRKTETREIEFSAKDAMLLALLGASLSDGPSLFDDEFFSDACAVDGAFWESVRQELQVHAVLPLTLHLLPRLPLSPDVQARWEEEALAQVTNGIRVQFAEAQVVELLRSAGIPAAVLKGSAAAQYYPRPELRVRGDADILVPPVNSARSRALLEGNGWVRCNPPASMADVVRHIEYRKNGVSLELHHQFFSRSKGFSADNEDRLLYEALPSCKMIDMDGGSVSVLPDELNGLVILGHLRHHLLTGVGLRHLVDWGVFVAAVCDDAFWENTMRELVRNAELEGLACAAACACKNYLGLAPHITWCDEYSGSDKLAERLFSYVFSQGNFGRKQTYVDSHVAFVLARRRSPAGWMRHLQKFGVEQWPLAKTNALARRFAWAYKLGRYARQGMKGNTPAGFVRQCRDAGSRRALLKDLGINPD